MILGALGPVAKQQIMVKRMWWSSIVYQEVKKKKVGESGIPIFLQGHSSSDLTSFY